MPPESDSDYRERCIDCNLDIDGKVYDCHQCGEPMCEECYVKHNGVCDDCFGTDDD